MALSIFERNSEPLAPPLPACGERWEQAASPRRRKAWNWALPRDEGRSDRAHRALALIGRRCRCGGGRWLRRGRRGVGQGSHRHRCRSRSRVGSGGWRLAFACRRILFGGPRVRLGLRQRLGILVGDNNVAAFDRVFDAFERLGPALALPPAAARWVEFLAIAERIGQAGIGLAADRRPLRPAIAGATV